jgi:hypothetical protein
MHKISTSENSILLGTSVNKRSRKLGTVARVRRRPGQVEVRVAPPWLPGGHIGFGSRGNLGSCSARLCLVHAASEDVAYPYGPNYGTHQDEYPVVSDQVLVHYHRVGGRGERS